MTVEKAESKFESWVGVEIVHNGCWAIVDEVSEDGKTLFCLGQEGEELEVDQVDVHVVLPKTI